MVRMIRFCNILVLVLAACGLPAGSSADETNRPAAGIAVHVETRPDPPLRLVIAEVDLATPGLRLRVAPGGPDPDGPGRWQTTLMQPTRIAQREGFALVVNGDFFAARGIKDAEGTNSKYRAEIWGAVNGPAVTDGKAWSYANSNWPCLVVREDRKVTFQALDRPAPGDWEVVAGNTMLLEAGSVVPHKNKARHPRTAVGLNAKGDRLVLLVVDGRAPGIAVGMNYDELASEMLRLGCSSALNLDGGGSSVIAIRDPGSGKLQILNRPSDGRERAVANVLGVCTGRTER